jgi:DNA-directed RNA polymerase specialized sigma24 family protein
MTDLERYFQERTRERFAALVHRHQDAVFQAAWRVSGDVSTAEDVVQEVFVGLLEGDLTVLTFVGIASLSPLVAQEAH